MILPLSRTSSTKSSNDDADRSQGCSLCIFMFLLPIENAKRKIFTSVLDDSPLGSSFPSSSVPIKLRRKSAMAVSVSRECTLSTTVGRKLSLHSRFVVSVRSGSYPLTHSRPPDPGIRTSTPECWARMD